MKQLFLREIHLLLHHPVYIICMVVLPLFVTIFFTSVMGSGQPTDMPIGIVDMDNTSTTRKLTNLIDAFQSSKVTAHYPTVAEARRAIQRNEIYGFVYFPKDMTQDLISGRQPRMSVYHSNTTLLAGSLLYKEMRVLCTLGSAAVGQATMRARGATNNQMSAFLQPIRLDTHTVGNPWVNYNIYLSVMMIPTCFMLFVFLMTIYSLGTELKFDTREEWMRMANGNIYKAVFTKVLPHTIIYILVMYICMTYIFGILHFPAPGGILRLAVLGLLAVLAAQGFGIFIFGLIPSMRMAMSVSSLWGVLSFSMVGTAFPVFSMDAPLQTIAWLFPMRHYYLIYQLCIFNTYPLTYVIPNILTLIAFALLPMLSLHRMGKAFKEFGYNP